MTKEENLVHVDKYTIKDFIKSNRELLEKKRMDSPFIGLVRTYTDGKLNDVNDDSKEGWLCNMTIISGREFGMQALFKKFDPASLMGDVSTYKIDHFGIGSGGSTIDSLENITLMGPQLCDTALYSPLPINSSCLAIDADADIAKSIESAGPGGEAGTIELQKSEDAAFDNCPDYFTVVKCTCVIDNAEPAYLTPGDSVKIDEAMLYLTSPTNDTPKPFAHICFTPKFIEKETTFRVEWYILF